MSSKRRTFHVDWDSPSHETGTVKRRPTSLNASFSNDHLEIVEYYKLRDFVGGYSVRLLKSEEAKSKCMTQSDTAIKDNGNHSRRIRSSYPCKRDASSRRSDDDPEKFKRQGVEERSYASKSIEQRQSEGRSNRAIVREWEKDENSFPRACKIHEHAIEDETDKDFEELETICSQDKSTCNNSDSRKEFGLKLSREPVKWKSTACHVVRFHRAESFKYRSLIPRPKVKRSSSSGLVNSSSESSGIGSPLSPLSPQQDSSIGKDITRGETIKTSDSKSSGLGSPLSPDSPLSPESQKYSAFHLIHLQLEKLRNCCCDTRQAEVTLIYQN